MPVPKRKREWAKTNIILNANIPVTDNMTAKEYIDIASRSKSYQNCKDYSGLTATAWRRAMDVSMIADNRYMAGTVRVPDDILARAKRVSNKIIKTIKELKSQNEQL